MTSKESTVKLLSLLKPYKKKVLFIFFLLLCYSGINLLVPLMSKDIMDKGFIVGNYNVVVKLAFIICLLELINILLNLLTEYQRVQISSNIQYTLQEDAFDHIMQLENSFFDHLNTTELLGRIDTDIQYMKGICNNSVFTVITQCFSMIGGMIGLLILDYRLTFLVLIFVPFKILAVRYNQKKRKLYVQNFLSSASKFAGWFGDCVNGIREVKLFQITHKKKQEFKNLFQKQINNQKRLDMLSQYNVALDSSIIYILMMLLYVIGGKLVMNRQLTIGEMITFITYSSYVTGPITFILNIGFNLSSAIPSTKRYYEFLEQPTEMKPSAPAQLRPFQRAIEFHDVCFSYNKQNKSAMEAEHLNFHIEKNAKIAIIGENGSGKSTILGLLLRFLNPDKGEITLDGVSISNYSLEEYRSLFSVVSQNVYLFHDTIRNNICLYQNISDERIFEIVEKCGLTEFVNKQSLDYYVGDNGAMLSGGQKQKIALARALIHESPILIFDEATSNTDTFTENKLNQLLKTELNEKTVLIVTHKQDILKDMDSVFVMKNGRIIQMGVGL